MKKRADGRYQKSITINGKRKVFYGKTQAEINRKILEYKENPTAEISSKTFKEVAENWLGEYLEDNSLINFNKSMRAVYNRSVEYFGDKTFCSIDIQDVNLFLSKLIAKQYSKKTMSMQKCILNMIFRYALMNKYITNNFISDIKLPNNLPKTERQLPETSEIKKVNEHFEGFALLPYFLLYTGLRISEALAVTSDDIDFKNKTINIDKHVIHNGNRPVLENRTKTKNSVRKVILLDRLAEKLPHNFKGLLFCNENGGPLTKSQLRHRWRKYQNETGVTLTAHQLRHAYATMLFEAGIDLKDAQELMGHSDINLTRNIYTHIRQERKLETANKLNEFQF